MKLSLRSSFIQLFVLFVLIRVDRSTSIRRILRENHESKHQKEYYRDTALNFIRKYGLHYHLFDSFFNSSDVVIQNSIDRLSEKVNVEQHKKVKERFGLISDDENEHSKKAVIRDISEEYLVRDYDHYRYWNQPNATLVNESFHSLSFVYNPPTNNSYFLEYNNKFRYGMKINDRFFYIGFNYDIWEWNNPDSELWKTLGEDIKDIYKKNPFFVYFIGYSNNLNPKVDFLYCNFTFPLLFNDKQITADVNNNYESHIIDGNPMVSTKVEIENNILDVLNRPTENNIIRCQVPIPVLLGLKNNIHHVKLSLTRTSHDETTDGSRNTPLLKDIHIPRLHELDRRRYRYTMQTLLENLEDEMVIEWIVYNILLGIEHFYFFYNTKIQLEDLSKSVIKPFLDANIITLIYYPFLHPAHFAQIQQSAFNVHLNIFHSYTLWTGYQDVDEFYMPSSNFLPSTVEEYREKGQILPSILTSFAKDDGPEPGIMLDSIEMDCPVNSDNFYHGGANLRKVEPGNDGTTAVKQDEDAATALLVHSTSRPAVATHCFRQGFWFHEMKHGHGKMFLKPSKMKYLISPHRYNDYWIVWTTPNNGGLVYHFSHFRYTKEKVTNHEFSENQIINNYSLQQLTYFSLEALLGITVANNSASPV
jgi:hypothetical protein